MEGSTSAVLVRTGTMNYAIGMKEAQLSEAVESLRAGDRRRARRLLGQIVNDEPDNVAAWWYLAAVVDDAEQKIRCLRRVLELRPDHQEAAQLLNRLERRMVTVTPPMGTVRPVIETVEDGAGDLVATSAPERTERRGASDTTVAVVAVLLALVAIVGTVILTWTGLAEGVLGIQNPAAEPTLPVLSFDVPACSTGGESGARIVFVNNSETPVEVSRGPQGEEEPLAELAPGGQATVDTTADVSIRYAVTALAGGFNSGGAIIKVPARSVCRVPIY